MEVSTLVVAYSKFWGGNSPCPSLSIVWRFHAGRSRSRRPEATILSPRLRTLFLKQIYLSERRISTSGVWWMMWSGKETLRRDFYKNCHSRVTLYMPKEQRQRLHTVGGGEKWGRNRLTKIIQPPTKQQNKPGRGWWWTSTRVAAIYYQKPHFQQKI